MSLRFFALLSLLALLVTSACGRSGLFGSSPYDCPPDQVRSDGTCAPTDAGQIFHPDLAEYCQDVCTEKGCDQPGCCDCQMCANAPFCPGDMKGGDAGDPCADPSDCKKPECAGDPRCHIVGTEVCNNGLDDDDNLLIDCQDPACVNFPGCMLPPMCDPQHPNCSDPACVNDPQCQNLKCVPTVDFGTLHATGSSSTRTMNTTGTKDVTITQCAPGGAGMVVTEFRLSNSADVTLKYSQGAGEDHVFALFGAGINQACNQDPLGCVDSKSAPTGTHTYAALPAGHYYLVVQAFAPAGQGPITVTLSTPNKPEICNNGVDDNGNGLIDCAEASCANAPNCKLSQCNFDFNVGALVVNGPSKNVSFDTHNFDANTDLTCEAKTGGRDVVVRFTLKEPAGLLLNWNQGGDHIVGLMSTPPPGQPCDSQQLNCYDPSGRTPDEVAWENQPAGDYLFVFKALQPGDEGVINASISAFRPRTVELCHNGIDDDGDGFIDCTDPDCVGVGGCSAPQCTPDDNLGVLSIGDSKSVKLDILDDGTAGYHTSCSRGGAKGMVVHFSVVAQGGIAIGFDCTQTGDHVIDLFAAGGPRDTCDVSEITCADPNTLPFGCGYAVPNLQSGDYNVIVQGFTSGSEGSVDLNISVLGDRAIEICNNQIDDDNDGFIDCADRKCATSPACAKLQCRPDTSILPVPLDGSNTFRLVQTSGAAVQAHLPCATKPGGNTAVIELQLTAAADLKMTFNQIGNHDIGLYTKQGAGLSCDAGTLLVCAKSAGATSGMTSFSNVPAGRYYLVIAGDQPDTTTTEFSGAVNIALSGSPH
jgi:hypothetical protein